MRSPITASSGERPVSVVPKPVIVVLVIALLLQIGLHRTGDRRDAVITALPAPVAPGHLRVLALGDPLALSRFTMLWLQGFDHQPGISVPFAQLDYHYLAGWLDNVLALDPRSHYPLLSAARIYGEVPDDTKKRIMLEFVHKKFLLNPDNRWQWMAHAVYVAKHRIGDMQLALDYARELRLHTTADSAPGWARQMELFILEDMGEIESAKVLLGGLLESGVISDRNELRFFEQRLGDL